MPTVHLQTQPLPCSRRWGPSGTDDSGSSLSWPPTLGPRLIRYGALPRRRGTPPQLPLDSRGPGMWQEGWGGETRPFSGPETSAGPLGAGGAPASLHTRVRSALVFLGPPPFLRPFLGCVPPWSHLIHGGNKSDLGGLDEVAHRAGLLGTIAGNYEALAKGWPLLLL